MGELRPVQTRNVWRPNIIKHCLVTKHTNIEVGGQTVKTCLIKHRFKSTSKALWTTNYPVYLAQLRVIDMTECATSQVAIQRFKLKGATSSSFFFFLINFIRLSYHKNYKYAKKKQKTKKKKKQTNNDRIR